jgi:hypothetical protein
MTKLSLNKTQQPEYSLRVLSRLSQQSAVNPSSFYVIFSHIFGFTKQMCPAPLES